MLRRTVAIPIQGADNVIDAQIAKRLKDGFATVMIIRQGGSLLLPTVTVR
jgi:hypothetical protein